MWNCVAHTQQTRVKVPTLDILARLEFRKHLLLILFRRSINNFNFFVLCSLFIYSLRSSFFVLLPRLPTFQIKNVCFALSRLLVELMEQERVFVSQSSIECLVWLWLGNVNSKPSS